MSVVIAGFTMDQLPGSNGVPDTMRPWGFGNDKPAAVDGSEQDSELILFPVPGTLSDFRVRARTDPTGPGNAVYTINHNGAAAAAITVAQSAVPHEGSNLIDTIAVVAGDRVTCVIQNSAVPTGVGADIALDFKMTTEVGTRFFHFGWGNNLGAGVSLGMIGYGQGAASGVRYFVIPRDGTLKNFYVRNRTNFTTTATYEYKILVNGVASALGILIPLAFGANNASELVTEVPVVKGDYIECTVDVSALSGTDNMSGAVGYYYT